MYNFSSKTFVNKEYKLSDFLKQIKANKEVIEDSKKINSIKFKNVINASTLNCIEDKRYKNIYIIEIELNEYSIPRLFIEELDKNIAFHTYFVLKYKNEIYTMVGYKEFGNSITIDKYYHHDFHEEKRIEVPILSSVEDVYKLILSYEIGIKCKEKELANEYITRVNKIHKLDFQILKTEKAIIYETQPKKKFEYNERLRKYKNERNELLSTEG